MNNNRRKLLRGVIAQLENIEHLFPGTEAVIAELDEAHSDTEICCDEEEECYEALPENMMFTQRYDDMCDNYSDLCDAVDGLDTLRDSITDKTTWDDIENDINEVITSINNAIDR